MTLSFTHIVWIAVLLLSSFCAGWMLRRLRSLERESALDEALREAEERAGGVDAERQQHLSLLNNNLQKEAAATSALETSLRRKSNELTQARSALQEARAEIKVLKDAAANAAILSSAPGESAALVSERLTAALAERDRKLLHLEVEHARLDATNGDLERRHAQDRERAAQDARMLDERDRAIAALNEEVEKWRARVPKLAESLRARDAALAERQLTIDTLTSQLANVGNEVEAFRQLHATTQQQQAALQQEHDLARRNVHELARQLDELNRKLASVGEAHEKQIDEYEKRIAALSGDIETFTRENDVLRAERYELVRNADAIQMELSARNRHEKELTTRIEALGGDYAALQFERRSLANERAAHAATLATLEADRGGLALEVDMLQHRLHDATELVSSRESDLRHLLAAKQSLERDFNELKARTLPLEELLGRRDAELAERTARIETLETEVASLEAAARHRTAQAESERHPRETSSADPEATDKSLEQRLIQQMDKSHELMRAVQERDKQIAALARDKGLQEKSLAVLTQQLKDAREEKQRRAEGHATQVGGGSIASPAATDDEDWKRPPDADNLQVIRGIGRSFERKLNELGITRLSQIVNLEDDEIELIERELDMFKGRVVRDDWIGQAAALIADSGDLDRPLPPVTPHPHSATARTA